MNPLAAFILGLFIGWLAEWIIDIVYWRRKVQGALAEEGETQQRLERYKIEIANFRAENQNLKEQLRARDAELEALRASKARKPSLAIDDLRLINGVNEAMVIRLNEAGIHSFLDLGKMRSRQLRKILGERGEPNGKEAEIIKQARMQAGTLNRVDNLEKVDGIGSVIAGKLYEAGIFTYSDLASLTAGELRELVGDQIGRLADEEKILAHARHLAGL